MGAGEPRSFVVQGFARHAKAEGFAFYAATDGRRELVAVYDLADGSPLFLSDGRQVLVYDVFETRLVRLEPGRGHVRVQWDAGRDRPLGFEVVVGSAAKEQTLVKYASWFRIDQFVDASRARLKRLGAGPGAPVYAAERDDGSVDAVQTDPRDPSRFRFTSLGKGEDFYRFELVAKHVGGRPPDEAVAFPDLERLRQDGVAVREIETKNEGFLTALREGVMFTLKLALTGGPGPREKVQKAFPRLDLEQLRKRDAEFGAKLRAALKAQGLPFPPFEGEEKEPRRKR